MEVLFDPGDNCKCVVCSCYLSVFPIFVHQSGSICGRCSVDKNIKSEVIRNFSYEEIAQHIKFPCRFKSSGCVEKRVPSKMKQHERECKSKQYLCPSLNQTCQWKGDLSEIYSHVTDIHPNFILSNPDFEIDIIRNYDENYILFYSEYLYVLHISFENKPNIFYYSLYALDCNEKVKNYYYKLEITKQFGTRTFTTSGIPVSTGDYTNFDKSTAPKIAIEDVRKKLEDPVCLICNVIIYENMENEFIKELKSPSPSEDSVDSKFLSILECPVCQEYMVPPIFQCLTGHVICKNCKGLVEQCPECRSEIADTRNFQLEQITSCIDYPCMNSDHGCTFVGKADSIRDHESTCSFGPHLCPFSSFLNCKWMALFSSALTHCEKHHAEYIAELPIITFLCNNSGGLEGDDFFLIPAMGQLFFVYFVAEEHDVKWAVQYYGPKEDAKKYCYEIDFKDNSGANRRLFVKRPCSPITEYEMILSNSEEVLKISKDLLKEIVAEGDLVYSCHIVTNS